MAAELPKTTEELEDMIACAYDRGYCHGMTVYAWWANGVELVGTTGRTLKASLEDRKTNYNYAVPQLKSASFERSPVQ